jgi:hypothetical protein
MKTCRLCPESGPKPESAFGRASENRDGLDSRCKECRRKAYAAKSDVAKSDARKSYWTNVEARRAQKNEYHHKNRHDILEKRRSSWASNPEIRERSKKYRASTRRRCIESMGGECASCKTSQYEVLCIDHVHGDGFVDRGHEIGVWNKILCGEDLHKYQVLCFNCNLKKERLRPPPDPTGQAKKCPTCRTDVDVSLFKKHRQYPDGLYYECSPCIRARELVVKRSSFLKIGDDKCLNCGETDIDVLSVDHVHGDGGGKTRGRGNLGSGSYKKVLSGVIPLSSVRVLCMNCNILARNGLIPAVSNTPSSSPQVSATHVSFEFSQVLVSRRSGSDTDAVRFLEAYHYAGYGMVGPGLSRTSLPSMRT